MPDRARHAVISSARAVGARGYPPTVATALYRRYRPESFAEVIGQEHVTDPLRTALREGRVGQAYLFSGPRGCGKTTSARILARCLNCAQGPTDTPCGVCDSCVELSRGGSGSLDVAEIDAASHGGVDDARELRERATFSTVRDRYKVYIVDEAHMVSPQGFNALLKIVEEPPPHVVFLFATTEPEKVLATIRSRTHHYPFRLVPPETLTGYLEQVCAAEGVSVGPGVLPLVVRAGAGSVRDSLSVLDQLATGSTDATIGQEQALDLLGYTPQSLLDDAVSALAVGDGAAAFRAVDRVVGSGQDPRRFVDDLLQRLRDLIIVEAVGEAAGDVFPGCPSDQLERMAQQAGVYGTAALSRAADLANTASSEMTGATSPRLHLELLVARLLLPAADDGQSGLAARLERVERRLAVPTPAAVHPPSPAPTVVGAAPAPTAAAPAPAVVAPAPPAAVPDPPAVVPAPPTAASGRGEVPEPPASRPAVPPTLAAPEDEPAPVAARAEEVPDADGTCQAVVAATGSGRTGPVGADVGSAVETTEAVRRQWPDVLHHLTTTSRRTWTRVAHDAAVLEVDAERLVLQFKKPGPMAAFSQGPHAENVRAALSAVLGMDRAVVAVSEGGAAVGGGPAPSAPAHPEPPVLGGAPRPSGPATRAAQGGTEPIGAGAPSGPALRPVGGEPAAGAPTPDRAPAATTGYVPGWDDVPPPTDDDEPVPDDGAPPEAGARRPSRPAASRGAPAVEPVSAYRRLSVVPEPTAAAQPQEDDEPSRDDADAEDSGLVGAALVAARLGGRVVEP